MYTLGGYNSNIQVIEELYPVAKPSVFVKFFMKVLVPWPVRATIATTGVPSSISTSEVVSEETFDVRKSIA